MNSNTDISSWDSQTSYDPIWHQVNLTASIIKLKISRHSPVYLSLSQATNLHQVPLISDNQRQSHRLSTTRKLLSVVRPAHNGAYPFAFVLGKLQFRRQCFVCSRWAGHSTTLDRLWCSGWTKTPSTMSTFPAALWPIATSSKRYTYIMVRRITRGQSTTSTDTPSLQRWVKFHFIMVYKSLRLMWCNMVCFDVKLYDIWYVLLTAVG